jgi:hypothetical protein
VTAAGLRIDDGGRECTGCLVYLPWENFSLYKSGPYGRDCRCRVCRGLRRRGGRKAQPRRGRRIHPGETCTCLVCEREQPLSAYPVEDSHRRLVCASCLENREPTYNRRYPASGFAPCEWPPAWRQARREAAQPAAGPIAVDWPAAARVESR